MAIRIEVDDTQLRTLTADLRDLPERVALRLPGLVRHYGQLLEGQVKRNASTGYHAPGKPHIPGTGPGPNVATGDYRRSISAEYFRQGPTIGTSVGSNAAQAARLEWGFDGADSLGRLYHDPPRPHFGPALDAIEGSFIEAVEALGIPGGF